MHTATAAQMAALLQCILFDQPADVCMLFAEVSGECTIADVVPSDRVDCTAVRMDRGRHNLKSRLPTFLLQKIFSGWTCLRGPAHFQLYIE